jgi:hypothetical protein
MRQLRQHSQATVAELKTFLAEMKGRSPQEMLGMVSGHPLVRAMVQSAALLLAILLGCTAVPYWTRDQATPPPPTVESAPPPAAPEPVDADPTPEPPPEAAEILGVGEEKQAPPKVNPLDTDTGNFLDDLE